LYSIDYSLIDPKSLLHFMIFVTHLTLMIMILTLELYKNLNISHKILFKLILRKLQYNILIQKSDIMDLFLYTYYNSGSHQIKIISL